MPTIDQLTAALMEDPNDPVLHFSLGHAYQKEGQVDSAIKHFRLAAQHKPDYSAAWFEWARLAERTDRLAAACEAYEGAMNASGATGDDHILKAAQVRLRRLKKRMASESE